MTNRPAGSITIRPISTKEFPEYYRSLLNAFGEDVVDAEREADLSAFEPQRSLAVLDGSRIVGTAGAFTRKMTMPGAVVPIAAVTLVSVAPTHRRRGLLTELMRRQLTELFESQGEPVAALWASEADIYGRFGYGLSSREATLTGNTRSMRVRPGDRGDGRIRLVTMEELRQLGVPVFEQVRPETVGWLDRPGRFWDHRFRDAEHNRAGASTFRAIVHEEPDGTPSGYAVYRTKAEWQEFGPDGELRVHEVVATKPTAYAALWGFMLDLDLVRRVRARHRPVDEPLQHLVSDARAVRLSLLDNMWVRTVDVGRALAARRYAQEIDVIIDVSDDFCPWNAGRWRLSGGPTGAECARTADPADLALSSTELGAALLGGNTLSALAASGRVRELRAGALETASRAFAHDRQPWCPDDF